MELTEFLKNFKDQFEEEDFELDETTEFRSLDGWDSMTSLMVVAMFDDIYGVAISSDDLDKSETLYDLFKLTKKS